MREHEAKEAIAQLCVAELKPGDAIFIDSGSTTQLIADLLAATPDPPRPSHLTVLTNSIGVAQAVSEVPGIEHVLLGGHVRRVAGSVVGSLTLENLSRFVVNVAFIGVSGLSEGGVTVADLEEARLKAAVIGRARSVAAPLDHTKLGTTHFAKICDLADIDVVITDASDEDTRRLCAKHGIRLVEPVGDDRKSRQ